MRGTVLSSLPLKYPPRVMHCRVLTSLPHKYPPRVMHGTVLTSLPPKYTPRVMHGRVLNAGHTLRVHLYGLYIYKGSRIFVEH